MQVLQVDENPKTFKIGVCWAWRFSVAYCRSIEIVSGFVAPVRLGYLVATPVLVTSSGRLALDVSI